MFGRPDVHRKHNESKFTSDLRALVDHLQKNKVHTIQCGREVQVPMSAKGRKGSAAVRRGCLDAIEAGALSLNGGKWTQFLRDTTYDPALGYPLEEGEGDAVSEVPLTDTVFDNEENPLTFEVDVSQTAATETLDNVVRFSEGIEL